MPKVSKAALKNMKVFISYCAKYEENISSEKWFIFSEPHKIISLKVDEIYWEAFLLFYSSRDFRILWLCYFYYCLFTAMYLVMYNKMKCIHLYYSFSILTNVPPGQIPGKLLIDITLLQSRGKRSSIRWKVCRVSSPSEDTAPGTLHYKLVLLSFHSEN